MKSFLTLGYFTALRKANRPVQAVSLASPLGYVHIVPNEFSTGWKFARLGVRFKRYHANRYRMKFKPQAVQKANILSQCQ